MAGFSGGCLCGAIRYEVTEDPIVAMRCHCRDCQYVSGGEPADVVVVPSASVCIVRGNARRYWKNADSGVRVYRSFCPKCGTPLFAGIERHPEVVAIKIGSLDEPGRYPPGGHIWTASAQSWHCVDPSEPAFANNPPL